MAGSVLYDLIYPGGAYQDEFIRVWSDLVKDMDTGVMAAPARMESDPSGAIRDAAVAEHGLNYWPHPEARKYKYRNSTRRRRDGSLWSWEIASSIHDVAAKHEDRDSVGIAGEFVLG